MCAIAKRNSGKGGNMPQEENKMGVMPVKKLIVNMSLPMMISMLVQALYGIVDAAYVGHYSADAFAGLTYAYPMQNLMLSVAAGTGVGINAVLSKALGEKEFERSNRAGNNGITLGIISAIVFMLLSITGAKAFISSQTSNAVIAEQGTTYLRIVMMLSLGLFMQVTFERLLISTGKTFYTMITQSLGAIINIIMDPIMIFGYFGCPEMGVAGAAYATIIGQSIAAALALYFNLSKNTEIHFSLKGMIPDGRTVRTIYIVGIPSILMMAIGTVMTYLMDLILSMRFSDDAVSVFGAYFKLQSFFFMPVFGLNNGVIPVLAYNWGARKGARIKEALSFAVKVAIVIMCIGTLVFELIPGTLLKVFGAGGNVVTLGIPALRIIAIHFPIAAVGISLGSVFQAFGKSIYSLIVSTMRQLVALIPIAYLMSLTGNLDMVWLSFPLAELVSVTVTLIFYRKVKREIINPIIENN